MRLFTDTEFVEDGRTIDLLSIGVVREDGAEYYAEPAEADRSKASPWVVENVLPYLTGPVKPRAVIAEELRQFAGVRPEWWGGWCAYDWVAICQLYGPMIEIPAGWPYFCLDVVASARFLGFDRQALPPDGGFGDEHNALADARWVRAAWERLQALREVA